MQWVVEFGSLVRPLHEIHPDTGLPRLVAPLKKRFETSLKGDFGDLTIVLRIDPRQGLMHAFRGPEQVVRKAQAALLAT